MSERNHLATLAIHNRRVERGHDGSKGTEHRGTRPMRAGVVFSCCAGACFAATTGAGRDVADCFFWRDATWDVFISHHLSGPAWAVASMVTSAAAPSLRGVIMPSARSSKFIRSSPQQRGRFLDSARHRLASYRRWRAREHAAPLPGRIAVECPSPRCGAAGVDANGK